MKIKNRRVFVCSDHHFGQNNFYSKSEKYGTTMRPEFIDKKTAERTIIKNHNDVVPEFDSIVYFLGDIASNVTNLEKIDQLNGQYKVLVAGNHDAKFTSIALNKYFHQVLGCTYLFNKKYVLTHIPIHDSELRNMVNIHGHLHRSTINDNRYISACLEVNDYTPIELTP